MSTSTDAYLCYGFCLEDEDWEAPWDTYEYDFDPKNWWYEKGTGVSPREVTHTEVKAYCEKAPCPVEPVNYCSGEYPMWILAIPGSVRIAYRGDPTRIDLGSLSWWEVANYGLKTSLLHLLKSFGFENPKLQWWLCSYWG